MFGSQKVIVEIEYDGTVYHGWQIQKNAITIEGVLQKALTHIFPSSIPIHACSRTDAGVHAHAQLATLVIPIATPLSKLHRSLNAILPTDIRVHAIHPCPMDFSIRKEQNGKQYSYHLLVASQCSAIDRQYCWWVGEQLDLSLFKENAKKLVGTHDFAAFRASSCRQMVTTKHIRSIDIKTKRKRRGNLHVLYIDGSSFLHRMVRIIVGSLVNIAKHKLPEHAIDIALQTGDRKVLGKTAPPHGLFLEKIYLDSP